MKTRTRGLVGLLLEIRLAASEECRMGRSEACRIAEEAEESLKRILTGTPTHHN